MSDDAARMAYDDELTDDDPVMIIRLSSHWIPYLLAVASVLKNPELWSPEDDVDLALFNVQDMLVRLLGSDEEWDAMITEMPFCIPAVSMYWYDAVAATPVYYSLNKFLTSHVYTNSTDSLDLAASFTVPLQPGDYVFTLHYIANVNVGGVSVIIADIGAIIDDFDMYATPVNYVATKVVEFEIVTPALYTFNIMRTQKTAPSTAAYLNMSAVSIRHKNAEE